jgi:hypothetical protein
MTSRDRLTSVCYGTATAFASRNNDVDGWWALGLLLAALPPMDPYRLDLLSGDAVPDLKEPGLNQLGSAWATYFRWSVRRHSLPIERVRSAELVVGFDQAHDVPSWIPGGRDRQFECTVTVADDAGHAYSRTATGHCSRPTDFDDGEPPGWRPRRSSHRGDPGRVRIRIGDVSADSMSRDIPHAE